MKAFHWDMQERDKRSFLRFFLIFDSSLTFLRESDFVGLLNFLQRKLEKLSESSDTDWNGDFCNRWISFSVREVFIECAKTSFIKSGWLLAIDKEEVLWLSRESCLHALVSGNDLGRTAKDLSLMLKYVPPDRSSKNSSSSDELIRSSAKDDWRESDFG